MKPLYRFFPLFAALLVAAIVGTGIYGGLTLRALFYERITAGLENTALMLKDLMLEGNYEDLDVFCKNAGTEYTRVTIIGPDGVVLGDSLAAPATMENHATRPEIVDAYGGQIGSATRYSDTVKSSMVYLALPSFDIGGKSLVLRTATAAGALNERLQSAYTQITIAASALLLLLAVLGFIFMRRTTGALEVIQTAVREYANGNLTYVPLVYRPRGLKEVAETISSLAGNLHARVHEVSRQRDELEAVFGGMEEAVIVLDTRLTIREMNHSARSLTEYEPEEAAGKELLLVFRNSELHDIAQEVKKTKGRVEGEIVLFGERERHLQVHGSMISGLEAEDARLVLVLNDVSRLKELERVRKDFVANVSHELKTPITAVKGYVETLLEGEYDNHETLEQFLHIVLQHVDRLSAIVEDLLIVSRLETGSVPAPEFAPCDLYDLLCSVAAMYAQRASDKGIELGVECERGEVIQANRVLMEQAVSNLVDNALKYSADDGVVTVAVASDEESVTIRVSDHGSGIPEKHLARIFERFYRVDKGRSRELGGTGLGLSIVKHIASSHGGQVTVESAEGEGSTFSIILPRKRR